MIHTVTYKSPIDPEATPEEIREATMFATAMQQAQRADNFEALLDFVVLFWRRAYAAGAAGETP